MRFDLNYFKIFVFFLLGAFQLMCSSDTQVYDSDAANGDAASDSSNQDASGEDSDANASGDGSQEIDGSADIQADGEFDSGSETDGQSGDSSSPSWHSETIQTDPYDFMVMPKASTAIVVDSSDKVRISYYSSANGILMYATNASGTMERQTVATPGPQGIDDHDMVLDTRADANKPHIIYIDSPLLFYAKLFEGNWQSDSFGSNLDVHDSLSAALNNNGDVEIVYKNGSSFLYYAQIPATGPLLSDVGVYTEPGAVVLGRPTIVIPSAQSPIVIMNRCPDGSGHGSLWSCYHSGAWGCGEMTACNSLYGHNPSMVYDGNDMMHVIYYNYETHFISYYSATTGGCFTSGIHNTGAVENEYICRIARGPENKIYAVCYPSKSPDPNLILFRLSGFTPSGEVWQAQKEILENTCTTCGPAAIAIDSLSRIHISYFDYSGNEAVSLKYLWYGN